MTLKETITWLSVKSIEDKIMFNELLLFEMTVMNRSIWSDPETTDKAKVDCLKWSNELTHRIWNLLFELKRGNDVDSEIKLVNHINFYQHQSEELARHIGATIKMTIKRYHNFNGLKTTSLI